MVARPRGGAADGDATRAALIEAALRLFTTQSVDSVSVRAINREAGVAPAAVHYHFGSKEALVVAAVERYGLAVNATITAHIQRLLEAPGQPDPADLVAVLADAYRHLLVDHPVYGRAWLNVVAQLSDAADPWFSESQAPVDALLHQLARRVFPDAASERVRTAVRLGALTLIRMTVQDGVVALADVPTDQLAEVEHPDRGARRAGAARATTVAPARAEPGMLARFVAGGLVAAING
ncbi:TetR/AcrR family transcriptional regulator [Klenkia sp. LSe6-5]|uniref:TetR/AcrR family transcriptional regulator n=1 Tax=Klenkia sesuvii TaxID=3103137 RepID=A0ABU8DYQ5_9ACTN